MEHHGSGKSYFVKLMINRNRFLNIQQFVIDPDREYLKLCEKLGGTVIKFGAQQILEKLFWKKGNLFLEIKFLN